MWVSVSPAVHPRLKELNVRQSNQLSPMRSLILLAVTWVAGTLLFAAEQTPSPVATPAATQPQAPTEQQPAGTTASDATSPAPATGATDSDADDESAEVAADSGSPAESVSAQENAEPSEQERAKSATAADTRGAKSSPQRFVPSEQVRADFDVSFPIDI